MLERSKLFSKTVMTMAKIPTARYEDLTENFKTQESFMDKLSAFSKPVIKISGPSLGKGVFVCDGPEEANDILKQIKASPMAGLEDGIFVEEGLTGKEVSFFYACNDQEFSYLGSAQDHKRLLDQDHGPNTGGMGAFSPVPWVDEAFIKEVTNHFLKPTLLAMKEMGTPFKGVLFLGLMVTQDGPYLLEYNVRFGDPETQTLLPLIEGDFSTHLLQISRGQKADKVLTLKKLFTTHVVKAAKGYPGNFGEEVERNQRVDMTQLTRDKDTQIFFAGVTNDSLGYLTSGGRVFGITAWGESLQKSRELVYEKMKTVGFSGEQMRSDIGEKL
jgi:phosphoribosylamine--glycine ligase